VIIALFCIGALLSLVGGGFPMHPLFGRVGSVGLLPTLRG
jgi:hypothetical protein